MKTDTYLKQSKIQKIVRVNKLLTTLIDLLITAVSTCMSRTQIDLLIMTVSTCMSRIFTKYK